MKAVYHVATIILGNQQFECYGFAADGSRKWYRITREGTPIPCGEPRGMGQVYAIGATRRGGEMA